MTEYQRSRRRTPEPVEATEETAEGKPARRRRAKIGQAAMKLKAPERKGYKRRFAVNTPERVAELEDLGYTVVSDSSIPSSGLGTGTVQRPAGFGEDGTYRRHILMETPDELYAQGRDELERHNAKVDQAILAGRDREGRLPDGESYGEGRIEVSRG